MKLRNFIYFLTNKHKSILIRESHFQIQKTILRRGWELKSHPPIPHLPLHVTGETSPPGMLNPPYHLRRIWACFFYFLPSSLSCILIADVININTLSISCRRCIVFVQFFPISIFVFGLLLIWINGVSVKSNSLLSRWRYRSRSRLS